MEKKFYLILAFLLSCTNFQNKELKKETLCNSSTALEISDKYMLKRLKRIDNLKKSVLEQDSAYIINYDLIETGVDGGGGKLTISKYDCKIINVELYQ